MYAIGRESRPRALALIKGVVPVLSSVAAIWVGREIATGRLGWSSPLALALVMLILIAAALRPHVGVFVLLVTLWLDQLYPWSGVLTLNRAVGLAALGGIVARRAIGLDHRRFVVGRFDYACWVYVLIALLSALVNGPTGSTWEYLRGTVAGYLIYWVMVNALTDWQRLRTAAWVIVGCSLIVAISALVQALTLPEALVKSRITGVQSVEATGFASLIATTLVLWLEGRLRGPRKVLCWATLPCFAIALILSGNRTALVALGALILLLGILRPRDRPGRGKVLLVVLAVLAGMVVVSSLAPTTIQRTLNIPAPLGLGETSDPNVLSRILLSWASWRMFLDHPLLGVGFGNFRYYSVLYAAPPGVVEHNLFTGTLGQMGILGMTALILMYSTVIPPLWKAAVSGANSKVGHAATYVLSLVIVHNIVVAVAHGGYIRREMFVVFALGTVVRRLLDTKDDPKYRLYPPRSSSPNESLSPGVGTWAT
ncbi:MAG TPA: hypothetical protein ENI39_03800 [Anaerolineae bacterium]|nr:hypothetical protein [Anaerolineae bacterium]